jgi:hypothetical protein
VPTPTFVFAAIFATLIGAAFHFIMGGTLRRLLAYIAASWLGFTVGNIIGVVLQINALNVGTLRLLSAILGAVTALIAVWILTRARKGVV